MVHVTQYAGEQARVCCLLTMHCVGFPHGQGVDKAGVHAAYPGHQPGGDFGAIDGAGAPRFGQPRVVVWVADMTKAVWDSGNGKETTWRGVS